MSHWDSHLDLEELYTNGLFKRKNMNGDMESGLPEASEINSKNEKLASTEESNVDEDITAEAKASNNIKIDPKKNVMKKHIKTTNIDNEINNRFGKRGKVYTTQWSKIYEVIEEYYITESDIFPYDYIKM